MAGLPSVERAVQLVGPDKLAYNDSKPVPKPGKHQIVCKVEACGLCFSDLKLLKQFSGHVRKSKIVSGIEPKILKEIPSYVVDEEPGVPGHEAVVRIAAVGPGVERYKVGERYLVQTDYRWLPTANANAAFGYNIEGGLQEYVLMDERIITSPEGESMLIPASEKLSASAIALVEPWACVEDAYVAKERQRLKEGGRALIVVDTRVGENTLPMLFAKYGTPKEVTWISKGEMPPNLPVQMKRAAGLEQVPNDGFDDVIYFGSTASTAAALFPKVAARGLLNIVQCGGKFSANVATMIGRVHYGGIRIIGTTSWDPSKSMEAIPANGEIGPKSKINVIGAGGPMGAMHVIRNLCSGIEGISVYAGDVDEVRLAELSKIALPMARAGDVEYKAYNSSTERIALPFDYIVVLAPIANLVANSVNSANRKAIINIFAGIPANVSAEINLDRYIDRQLYFIGTSGSVLSDMKQVLAKVGAGTLDTNVSVAAVSGLEGACDGIRAVENRIIAGKIIVYPACKGLGLTTLKELAAKRPDIAKSLKDGLWTKEAEQKLLEKY